MTLKLRPGSVDDAEACGRILFEAFGSIAAQHNFQPDFPAVDVATGLATMLLSHPGFHSVVAEEGGRPVGCNFLDERSTIAGVGPVAVDPPSMNGMIGRQLMLAVMNRASERRFPGVRLLQAAWHCRSLSLYAKLGFEVRETISALQGPPLRLSIRGYEVRTARESDVPACNALCFGVHGHDRAGELLDAVRAGTANVVERQGRITGYATAVGWFHHAVAETNDDMKALIGAAPDFPGPGFLVPSRNGDLFRWCLANKLRVVMQTTLMTIGLYNEPAAPYLPSILY